MSNKIPDFSSVAVGLAMEDPDLQDRFRLRIGCQHEIEAIGEPRSALLLSVDQATVRQNLAVGYQMSPGDTAKAIAHCLVDVAGRSDIKVGLEW